MKHLFRLILAGTVICITMCLAACTKEAILGCANAVMLGVGQDVLTKDTDLTGGRTFGVDSYTGTYTASYEDATVKETLFGNTSIERAAGKEVRLRATITTQNGSASLLLLSGTEEPKMLLEDGNLEMDLEIEPSSQYILFETKNFTGTLDMSIE